MKRVLALVLALVMVFALVSCGSSSTTNDDTSAADTSTDAATTDTAADGDDQAADSTATDAADIKIGVILVGDENEAYTYAHIKGIKEAAEALNIPDDAIIWKYSITEDEICADTATDLAEEGCNLIISNSYGHQTYMETVAAEYPDITFISMTGDRAAISGLSNFKNAFTCVYQSRYVSGVVAGMKLQELIDDNKLGEANYDDDGNVKIGYVGAYPYAEVVSGYTGFYLGIKSIVENVSMEVTYTNSWFDITAEAEAANSLIADGCVIIGQHSDSTGCPSAIQEAYENGTVCYNVGYNLDMTTVAPDAALTSAINNWVVYYTYAFQCMLNGTEIETDWAEGYDTGAVAISALGASCAEGTAEKVAEVEAAIQSGELKVFSTDNFTVNGEKLDSYLIDTNGDFVNDDEEAIWDGEFHESYFRSAPAFDIRIDGITELN
jgi:basic membrane protein A